MLIASLLTCLSDVINHHHRLACAFDLVVTCADSETSEPRLGNAKLLLHFDDREVRVASESCLTLLQGGQP